jgi:hypothetical protein
VTSGPVIPGEKTGMGLNRGNTNPGSAGMGSLSLEQIPAEKTLPANTDSELDFMHLLLALQGRINDAINN